jgi:hypothetical protein
MPLSTAVAATLGRSLRCEILQYVQAFSRFRASRSAPHPTNRLGLAVGYGLVGDRSPLRTTRPWRRRTPTEGGQAWPGHCWARPFYT